MRWQANPNIWCDTFFEVWVKTYLWKTHNRLCFCRSLTNGFLIVGSVINTNLKTTCWPTPCEERLLGLDVVDVELSPGFSEIKKAIIGLRISRTIPLFESSKLAFVILIRSLSHRVLALCLQTSNNCPIFVKKTQNLASCYPYCRGSGIMDSCTVAFHRFIFIAIAVHSQLVSLSIMWCCQLLCYWSLPCFVNSAVQCVSIGMGGSRPWCRRRHQRVG